MKQDDADAEQQSCISQCSKTRSVTLGINWLFQTLVLTQGLKHKPKPLMQGRMCPVTATPADLRRTGNSSRREVRVCLRHSPPITTERWCQAHVIVQATPNSQPKERSCCGSTVSTDTINHRQMHQGKHLRLLCRCPEKPKGRRRAGRMHRAGREGHR